MHHCKLLIVDDDSVWLKIAARYFPDFRVALKFATSLDESPSNFGCPVGKIGVCS
jgi:hypothetical protein